MRRVLIVVVALVLLAFGAFQFRSGLVELLPGLGVGADMEVKTAAQKAAKAANDFMSLTKDSTQSGIAPRQSDASAAPLLDAVFDIDLLKAKSGLGTADLGSLADWTAAGGKVGIVYILAGTGVTDITKAGSDPRIIDQINRNTALFAPELGRYMDIEVRLGGAMASILAGDTGQRSGLDKVRSGLTSTLSGVITTLGGEGLADDWRLARLVELKAAARQAAKLLLPEQCASIRDLANQVGQVMNSREVKTGLLDLNSTLKC